MAFLMLELTRVTQKSTLESRAKCPFSQVSLKQLTKQLYMSPVGVCMKVLPPPQEQHPLGWSKTEPTGTKVTKCFRLKARTETTPGVMCDLKCRGVFLQLWGDRKKLLDK